MLAIDPQSLRSDSAGSNRAARQAGYTVDRHASTNATPQMRSTSAQLHVRRQVAHEIDARVQELEPDEALQAVHELLQIDRDEDAEHHAERRFRACRSGCPAR